MWGNAFTACARASGTGRDSDPGEKRGVGAASSPTFTGMNPPAASGFRRTAITALLERVVATTPVIDIHTHLYDPLLGGLLWGMDDLLIYHYLAAEAFRYLEEPPEEFFTRPKTEQADRIWHELFLAHSPVSEACQGVLTTLHRFGLDPHVRDLPALRAWFAQWPLETHVSRTLEIANVAKVYMTNSPFDDAERAVWEKGFLRDERFVAALRIDPLLVDWPGAARRLSDWGYNVGEGLSASTCGEVRRFLADWTRRLDARYVMVSLPPDFAFPASSDTAQLIERVVLPHCQEFGLPLALMLGVRRAVNPRLQLAGDGVGRSDLSALARLCEGFPQNRFAVTVLSRENQHELCVLARKFRNLHVFGCWWFTNVPVLIEEITRLRLELLGLSFTVQHSDARVLEQIIYKFDHTRRILVKVLADRYAELAATGWETTEAEVRRDVRELLGGGFERFCQPAA